MKSICEVCGLERVKVTGMMCPEGHGRIHPPPTAYAELPVAGAAVNAPIEYWLLAEPGKQLPGLYRRVPKGEWYRNSRGVRLRRTFDGPTISARLNGRACKFTLIEGSDGTP